jgi:serine/threonine-protein kinase RsbW
MEIRETEINGNITMLEPYDDIDLYNYIELRDRFLELRKNGSQRIIIDLSNVKYVDSSGIGALVFLYTSAQSRNIGLRYTGLSAQVYSVLEKTGLHEVLPISGKPEDAVARLLEASPEHKPAKQLVVDDDSTLFDTSDMSYSELNIGFEQVRRLAALIAQKAPAEIREINILEQQVSELIKNAVKHGNKNDNRKAIRIWYSFSLNCARLIIEDQGEGFKRLEEWNRFYEKKMKCFQEHDQEGVIDFLSFRTPESTEQDGGNALFAAVEYWNCGVVFNEKRNRVAVKRIF